MESHIIIPMQAMDNTRYDMLTGMLLHSGKTLCEIQLSGHRRSCFHGHLCIVKNDTAFFVSIVYFHVIYKATVTELSAPLREKGCLIQYHRIAIFLSFGRQPLFTGQYRCLEFLPVAVLVI